jgi:GNAT superfamily N-acetyltransferase
VTALSFTLHDELPADDARAVDAGLDASNEKTAPIGEVRSLSCFARLPDGRITGGAVGRTWGECCELQQLWVDESWRHRGVGTRLVREFERGGAARGCNTFYLDTFSFQALDFYRSLGYEPRLEIPGFPGGIRKYVMMRSSGSAGSRQ